MSFHGQCAAAQLEKLDESNLFKRYCFPLARELAEYLCPPLLPGKLKEV